MSTEITFELRRSGGDPYDATYTMQLALIRGSGQDPERPLRAPLPVFAINHADLLLLSEDCEAYGRLLGARLFADPRVVAAFAAAQSDAQASEQPLRLRLDLSAAENEGDLVHSVRWEQLCVPVGDPISLTSAVLFSRYLPSPQPLSPRRPRPEELRALVVAASPGGLDAYRLAPVEAAQAVELARGALGPVPATVLAHSLGAPAASIAQLRQALRAGPQLVVLVGHGTSIGGRTMLWLEDEGGAIARVDGEELVEAIRQLDAGVPRPILMVLLTCQSGGQQHDGSALMALGPRLIDAGVAAVLAMQGSVTQATVLRLLPELLRELQSDGRIDRAVAVARAAIQDMPDWWAPVLFLRARDGRLWDASASERIEGLPEEALLPPPELNLIGRDEDLIRYNAQLDGGAIAVICGSPGVGKTALAAELARRRCPSERLFWASFSAEQGLGELLRRLAAFLALRGAPAFARTLASPSQRDEAGLNNRDLFDHMLEPLSGRGYLICLDDLQFLAARQSERADLEHCLRRLLDAARAGELELLVTAWAVPAALATAVDPRPLAGLTPEAAGELLAASGLVLADPLVERLTAVTSGNAQQLALVAKAFAAGDDPARLIEELATTGNTDGGTVAALLTARVHDLIDDAERGVLSSLALLRGEGTRAAIETLLGTGVSAQTQLEELERSNLLMLVNADPLTFALNGLLQPYYYHRLSDQERRRLHGLASRFYEHGRERDPMKVIEHAVAAEEYGRSAQLIDDHLWALVNRRQIAELRRALTSLDPALLKPLERADLELARGALFRVLGEHELARKSLEQALLLAEIQQPTPETAALQARACNTLGRLAVNDDPAQALRWGQRGLAALAEQNLPEQTAALHTLIGRAYLALDTPEQARGAYEHGLELMRYSLSPEHVDALMGLGGCLYTLGDLAKAGELFSRALAVAAQIEDEVRMLSAITDLAATKDAAGDWAGAVEDYRTAVQQAKQIGSPQQHARLYFNLGAVLLRQGSYAEARQAFGEAQQMAARGDMRTMLRDTLYGLTELALRTGDLAAARDLLEQARPLVPADKPAARAEGERLRAELLILEGDAAGGLAAATAAVKLSPDDDLYLEGLCLRARGAALLRAGDATRAVTVLRRSAKMLIAQDAYELARTQVWLSCALAATGKVERAAATLSSARETFVRLGANGDIAGLDQSVGQ